MTTTDMAPIPISGWLTPKKVEQYYGISRARLKVWRQLYKRSGVNHGPLYTRRGRLIYYQIEDIETWFLAGRVG